MRRETSPLSCRNRGGFYHKTGGKKVQSNNWSCDRILKKEEERELYVSSPVSWPLVPTEELRLMMRRRTSFLSKTREAGPSSDIALPPRCLYGKTVDRYL